MLYERPVLRRSTQVIRASNRSSIVMEMASAASERLTRWPTRAKVIALALAVLFVLEAQATARDGSDVAAPAPTTQPTVVPTSRSTVVTARPTASVTVRTTAVAPTAPPRPTTAPRPATTTPRTTTRTTPTAESELALLRRLPIDDSAPGRTGYQRGLFPTWLDLDGDGCDAREDALIAESLVKATVGPGCAVIAGDWRSLYDGVDVRDPSELDVDHMVPLGEAWRSGAYRWDAVRRAAYANDVSYPDHLIAVTASSNRSKSDSTPNEWRPPEEASWCRYATAWVHVKESWKLTVTTLERDALGQMLDRC